MSRSTRPRGTPLARRSFIKSMAATAAVAPLGSFAPPRLERVRRAMAQHVEQGSVLSTVDDYHAFSRMMLDKGKFGGGRILSRASAELMTSNQITPEQQAGSFLPESRGWGFGVSVVTKHTDLAEVPGRFGWDGGYGTSAYVDPTEGLIRAT